MRTRHLPAAALFVGLCALLLALSAQAQQATTLASSDVCAFFRNRAWGKGLADPATEMLWACEAISARRAAGIPLSERLATTEQALARFQAALREASAASFRPRGSGPVHGYGVRDEGELAESSGLAAALAAIRDSF